MILVYDVLSGKGMRISFLMTVLIIIISEQNRNTVFPQEEHCLTFDLLFQQVAEIKEDTKYHYDFENGVVSFQI